MKSTLAPIAVLAALLADTAYGGGPPAATYRLALDPALTTATVEFCLGEWRAPPRLVSRQREAERFRSPARVTRGNVRIKESRRGIRLSGAEPGDCIAYDVDLSRLELEGGERALRRAGNSVLTSSGLWLWRPEDNSSNRVLHLRIDMPPGLSASVPWEPVADDAHEHSYQLAATPSDWRDLTAFGELSFQELEIAGSRLRLAVADASPRADPTVVSAWIGEAAHAVSTLYGRFPLPSPQIVVVPIGRRAEAVPWAQVQRGGGASAHFYIDQHRPLDEFRDDWTATHELSHMLLPYVARRDAWLSEGMASYYQNVLRARAGMISHEQAWQKLYAGFERGRRGTRGDTLAEISRDMHRRGAYMRVYWSGAAIALLADVELRAQSGGEKTLDFALGRLADCCLPSNRTWTARELLTRLDELTDTDIFVGLYEGHINSARFPALDEASAALGIAERGGDLRFAPDPDSTGLRRAIMSAPTALLAETGPPDTQHDPSTGTPAKPGDSRSPRRTTP